MRCTIEHYIIIDVLISNVAFAAAYTVLGVPIKKQVVLNYADVETDNLDVRDCIYVANRGDMEATLHTLDQLETRKFLAKAMQIPDFIRKLFKHGKRKELQEAFMNHIAESIDGINAVELLPVSEFDESGFQRRRDHMVLVYMGDERRRDFSHCHFDIFSPPKFYTKSGTTLSSVAAVLATKKSVQGYGHMKAAQSSYRKEDMNFSNTEVYMRRSDSLKKKDESFEIWSRRQAQLLCCSTGVTLKETTKEKKTRLEAATKASKNARRRAEVQVEGKRKIDFEKEAARQALLKWGQRLLLPLCNNTVLLVLFSLKIRKLNGRDQDVLKLKTYEEYLEAYYRGSGISHQPSYSGYKQNVKDIVQGALFPEDNTTRYDGVSIGVRFDGCLMHVPLRFAHGLYYKVPNVELEMDLVRVSNAKELYYMFDVANAYGWLEMYVDHHDMKLSQYLEAVDTTIMDGVVAKWRGPPKTRYCNKFLVDIVGELGLSIEVEYDEKSMQIEEAVVQTKQIKIGLTDQVERATQDELVQGEYNQQQQQDNPVEHDNPETAIYVE
ncbi:hypothetical protein Tco_0348911 [Tanacetum coccineum]